MKPFRARSAAALYEAHHGPNMTPMVDVVMVILIFFMASAAILGPEWFLKTALPVAGSAPPIADQPVRCRVILGAGDVARLALDAASPETLPFYQVENRLRDLRAARGRDGLIVLVEPGPDAAYDDVVRVHEWCATLDIPKVGLAETPESPPTPENPG